MSDTMTLLLWLVKGTAVLVLAMALSAGLRRAPAGARYVVWLAALGVLLLVPPLSTWTPLRLPILPALNLVGGISTSAVAVSTGVAAARDAGTPSAANASASRPATPQTAAAPVPAATAATATRTALDLTSALMLAWSTIAAALFGWLALGALKVRRIVSGGRELSDQAWLAPMYDVADRLDLAHAPRLVMSDAVEMPFACGVLRPTIVLPVSAESWTEERRRVVLFHELAHVRRRDLLGHTLGRVTCVLYWFHPLVWSAAKRLRAESERACDDLVLACEGARASDYATHLLDIVTGVRRQGAPATALPMADKKEFEGRMLAILDPAARRSAPSRLQQMAVSAGFGALALSLAAVAPTRHETRAEIPANATSVAGAREELRLDAPAPSRMRPPRPQAAQQARIAPSPSPAPQPPPVTAAGQSSQGSQTLFVESVSGIQQVAAGPDTALLGRILRTDKDAGVRKSAAWALQGRRDGVPLLLERLGVDADPEVREMSAWALAALPADDVAAALAVALTHDKNEEVRGTAAWALGYMGTRANVAALETGISDEDVEVRKKSLWALARQRIDVAPRRVVELLQDDDRDVRIMAAWVLGEIRDKATAGAVRDAFGKERSHDVQEAEFRTLLLLGDRSQALIDKAMASDNPAIRARAVRLMAGHDMGAWPWPWPWPWPRPQP